MANDVTCYSCGKTFQSDDEDAVFECGHGFCSVDCFHDAGYEWCEHCGEAFDVEDSGYVAPSAACYCSLSCLTDDGFAYCERCGEVVRERNAFWIGDVEETWCSDCYDRYSYFCEACDCNVSDDHECPYGGKVLVHGYSYSDDVCFTLHGDSKGNQEPYIGVELEIETAVRCVSSLKRCSMRRSMGLRMTSTCLRIPV